MSSDEVLQKITHALAGILGLDDEEVSPTSTLLGDLQASSLDIVDLLFQMKKNFGINLTLAEVQRELRGDGAAVAEGEEQGFSDALFEKVTVKDLAAWVESRLPASA